MRRYWVVLLAVLTLLGVLSPPTFAQAPAAPTPKVTITGFIDNLVNWSRNMSQFDVPLGGITNPGDSTTYGRTRGRIDLIGELGKAKAVVGLEIDLGYGQAGATVNGFGKNFGDQVFGESGAFGANNDTTAVTEFKWMYVDFPVTGPGSLLPFVPWAGQMQVGGQPYALGLKPSILADSDFAGATIRMTVSPTLDWSFTYAQFEERNTGFNQNVAGTPTFTSFGRGDDWGIILKANYQATKELKVSPIYAFQELAGTTSGAIRRAVGGYGVGFANFAPDERLNSPLTSTGAVTITPCLGTVCKPTEEQRHTIGVDARWTQGPWYVAPTFFYQGGYRERFQTESAFGASVRRHADISAWIADVEAGYRMGPLLLQTRAMYTSGSRAQDNLNEKIHYYQPFQVDSTYWVGWGEVTPLSNIDYFQGLYTPVGGLFEGTNVGYDRYGRAQFSVKATYDVTPQLSPYFIITPQWTARGVPSTNVVTSSGVKCVDPGAPATSVVCTRRDEEDTHRYLGTDLTVGFTWRFAPGLAFDWVYGVLIPGKALDTNRNASFDSTGAGVGPLVEKEAKNVYTSTARVRYSF